MAKQVCGLKLLRGRTQREVISLLGEPDHRTEGRWEYRVETPAKPPSPAQSRNLVVLYDRNVVANVALFD
jgi:hypothetical protein